MNPGLKAVLIPGLIKKDPYFLNVSLLLHGDGAGGSTTITDSSPSPKTVTAVSGAQISTAQSKFGGASLSFNGSTSYLSIPASADFTFGTGDLTIEAWIYCTGIPNGNAANIWSQRIAGTNGITFRAAFVSSSGWKINFFYDNAGSGGFDSNTLLSYNTWHHVALTREGNLFKLWANGTLDGTSSVITASLGNVGVNVGKFNNGNIEFFQGFIDELRVTKVARYTSNFIPPTAPFPNA